MRTSTGTSVSGEGDSHLAHKSCAKTAVEGEESLVFDDARGEGEKRRPTGWAGGRAEVQSNAQRVHRVNDGPRKEASEGVCSERQGDVPTRFVFGVLGRGHIGQIQYYLLERRRCPEGLADSNSVLMRGLCQGRVVLHKAGQVAPIRIPGVKHVVAVSSAKGGVGKSTTSGLSPLTDT